MYRADAPEYARLFILAGKGISEDVFRSKFGEYGNIKDIWIVKDRHTNEDKGVVYITYSKASEAALAMEEMNGKKMPGNQRQLKVMVANTKRDGSIRDPREDERLTRIFVIIPKSFTESDLTKAFEEFGEVASVNVLRDKDSGQAKGFGYVRYHRQYHAALALEKCDRSYKPVFATPKKIQKESAEQYERDSGYYSRSSRYDDHDDRHDRRGGGAPGGYPYNDRDRGLKRSLDDHYDRDVRHNRRDDFLREDGRSRFSATVSPPRFEPQAQFSVSSTSLLSGGQSPLDIIQEYPHTNCQRLHITTPLGLKKALKQSHLNNLFNLIPGLEYCDLNEQTGIAYVRYQSPQCAAYARDRLDQFEYPIGSRLTVRYAENNMSNPDYRTGSDQLSGYRNNSAVHQAAKVLQQVGINPDLVLQQSPTGLSSPSSLASDSGSKERVTYCNLKLPLLKPLLPETSTTEQRLFIVCQPAAIPERILVDAFARFGSLIEIFLLPGRNFGYAKYGNKESAMTAIEVLHGQNIAGQRIKVIEAEPQRREMAGKNDNEDDDDDDTNKRQRIDQP